MKKIISIFILLIIGFSTIKAQDAYVLTLDESIAIAKQKSYDMLNLRERLKISEYNLKATTAGLKTQISMNFTLPDYQETVKQYEDSAGVVFYPARQMKYAGGLNINQPLPTDGRIFITSGLQSIEDFRNNLATSTLSTRIGFTQPVDIIYGYSSIKKNLKDAQLDYEQTNKVLKRAELDLVLEVSKAYYNLLSQQREVEIAYLDLERQTEAYEISKNKYEAGLIREVDALQMEVELAEAQSNYDVSVLYQESALNAFKLLVGLSLDDNITLNSDMDYKILFVDPETAVGFALQNRLEIRETEINIEKQKMLIKEQKVYGRVRGSLYAYVEKYEVNDIEKGDNLLNSIKGSYENFIDFSGIHTPKYGVGFEVAVPILDGGRNKSRVKIYESQLKQYTLAKENNIRSIEIEVRNLVSTLNSNLKRLQLLEKNIKVAEKSFDITLQRFSDGDIDSQSLALERNRLNTAYRSHLGAYKDYQLALKQLICSTFYDFENDRPVE